jgi:hypothetical protein
LVKKSQRDATRHLNNPKLRKRTKWATSILKVDSLVSWNFKHMVNFFRIRQYNSINLKFGYATIDIRTPKEVTYEDE